MSFNRKHTKEEIENLKLVSKGNKNALGYRFSDEQKLKIKGRYKGKKLSDIIKEKMSIAQMGNTKFLGKSHTEESKVKMALAQTGDKNHAWLGGKSFEPYTTDWTNTLRRAIRERDFYTCQVCKEPQGDTALSIHHIDYDKQNNDTENLIALCTSCHIKTNTNREMWKQFFNQKLYA